MRHEAQGTGTRHASGRQARRSGRLLRAKLQWPGAHTRRHRGPQLAPVAPCCGAGCCWSAARTPGPCCLHGHEKPSFLRLSATVCFRPGRDGEPRSYRLIHFLLSFRSLLSSLVKPCISGDRDEKGRCEVGPSKMSLAGKSVPGQYRVFSKSPASRERKRVLARLQLRQQQ